MTKATASRILQVCAIAFVVIGIAMLVTARKIAAQERDVVAGAEREVVRRDLDHKRDDDT